MPARPHFRVRTHPFTLFVLALLAGTLLAGLGVPAPARAQGLNSSSHPDLSPVFGLTAGAGCDGSAAFGPVRDAQRGLRQLGFGPRRVTGCFDEATGRAVRAYERRRGVRVDGTLEAALLPRLQTAAARDRTLDRGAGCGEARPLAAVRRLQRDLRAVGGAGGGPGRVTGCLGIQTDRALRRFQARRGLRVDGEADRATLAALATAVRRSRPPSAAAAAPVAASGPAARVRRAYERRVVADGTGPAAVELLPVSTPTFLLYVLYLGLCAVVTAVATTTLVWMLHAWRTPDELAGTSFEPMQSEPVHSFSILVPARHEEAVLATTLTRLAALEHPRVEILAIVGHDDDGTRAVAEAVAAAEPRVRVVVDHSWPKNKPKGLNTALPECRGDVVGVFDAEDVVHPSLLGHVDATFARTGADVVQGGVQLMNYGSSWYALRNVLEYYFWFRSRLHFHARERFIPLGGNTVFVRADVLREAGGWDAECLAEDCELGVRLSIAGKRTVVAYEPALVTREETPDSLAALVKQRTRWNQGFLQVFGKGLWRQLPLRQRALGAYTLATPFLQAAAGLLLPLSVLSAVALDAPVLLALLSFLPLLPSLAILAVEVAGFGQFCRDFGFRPSLRDYARLVLGFFPFQVVLAFAALRAAARELRGVRNWEKTAHVGAHLVRAVAAPPKEAR